MNKNHKFANNDYNESPVHSKTLNSNDQYKRSGFIFKTNESHS